MSSTVDTYLEEVKKHRKALARLVEKLEECEDDDQARRVRVFGCERRHVPCCVSTLLGL